LKLGASGSFPEKGKPRVLWVGADGETDNLIRLQQDVEHACSSLGYEQENKSFHPHITIGRVRDHRDAFALAEAHRAARIEPVEFVVSSIVIYESELRPTGSVYTSVASFPLNI
jgi:2'-5' RNA ligase